MENQNLSEELLNFRDIYSSVLKIRNLPYRKYGFPEKDYKIKEIDSIFRKNDYAIVETNNNIINLSGVPILSPKVIIVGDFEHGVWKTQNKNGINLVKGLANSNLIDGVLAYEGSNSGVEDIKEIQKICKVHNLEFDYNDRLGLQNEIRKLNKLNDHYFKAACKPNLAEDEVNELQKNIMEIQNKIYTLFSERAKSCATDLEKRIENKDRILQFLTLEEVSNCKQITEELNDRKIPFISYIPRYMPFI